MNNVKVNKETKYAHRDNIMLSHELSIINII